MPKEIQPTDLGKVIGDEYTSLMEERAALLYPPVNHTLTQSREYQFAVDKIHYQQKGIRRLIKSLNNRLGISL